jgi:hypothetical protein
MRVSILLLLLACESPRRPPPIVPMKANEPCPSSTDATGRVRYACSSHDVVDSIMWFEASLAAIGDQFVAEAQAEDRLVTATTRPIQIEGAADALVIEYARPRELTPVAGGVEVRAPRRAFDLLATAVVDDKVRLLQCEAPAVEDKRAVTARLAACTATIQRVLRLPAPTSTLTTDCVRALERMATLPGRPDSLGDAAAVRAELRRFAYRCTDQVAACALASTSYVEATVCW